MIYYTTHEGGMWKEIKINIKRSKIVKTLNKNHFGIKTSVKNCILKEYYIPAFSVLKGIGHSPVVHCVKMGNYLWDATFKNRRKFGLRMKGCWQL